MAKRHIRNYIKSGGIGCPYCGDADNTEGRNMDYDEGAYRQTMHCANCGREWINVYPLKRVIEIETGELR